MIFLSYARGDDEPFVKRLYESLASEGFDAWWDRTRMPNRALTFLQEIRDAIDASDRLIAVVGPTAIKSDYVKAEWDHALLFAKGVVPILRIGDRALIPEELRGDDYKLVPPELAKYHCPDFRAARTYNEAVAELIRILREPVPPLGRFLTAVPALPPHFLARRDSLTGLERLILADVERPVVITAATQTTTLYGMGGIGKSVLAAAFARSIKARRSFADGIVWLTIGQQPDLLGAMKTIGQTFDDDPSKYVDYEVAIARLPSVLENKVALIVLDDVWQIEHATPFVNVLGARCRLIVTTRDGSIATSLGAQEYSVDLLSEDDALALLARWVAPVSLPPAAREVVKECGRLAFALALCGVMAREGTSWEDILEALQSADLSFIKANLPNYEQYPHVLKAMQISLNALAKEDPEAVERYLELTIFPQDEAVPEAAVVTLWSGSGMSERAARRLLVILDRKSLLRREASRAAGSAGDGFTVSLHDLQYDYLRAKVSDILALDRRLLAAYRKKAPEGWHRGSKDGYFHQHLLHHLKRVEGDAAVRTLLFDYRWLEARLAATDVNGLLEDFQRLTADRVVNHVYRALRQAAHVLAHNGDDWTGREQLTSQLVARLLHPSEPQIQKLLSDVCAAHTHHGEVWLRPLAPSLAMPIALQRTLIGHQAVVSGLTVLSDGRLASTSEDRTIKFWNLANGQCEETFKVDNEGVARWKVLPNGQLATASDDGTLKLWNLINGHCEATFQGHNDSVTALALLPDGRLVSASEDRTIKLWNVTNGQCEATFERDGGTVVALALLPGGRLVSGLIDVIKSPEGQLSWNTSIDLWSIRAGKCEARFAVHSSDQFSFLRGMLVLRDLPDGRVVSGSVNGTIKLWNLVSGACEATLEGHEESVNAIVVLSDGQLASGSDDRTIKLWNLTRGECDITVEGHNSFVTALAALPDGKLASGSDDRTIKLWDLTQSESDVKIEGHSWSVTALVALPDERLASASGDGTIRLWNVTSAQCQAISQQHGPTQCTLTIVSDGRLASGSLDGTIKLWNLLSGECEATLGEMDDAGVTSLVALSDGRLASGLTDGTIKIWNLVNGKCEMSIKGHEKWLTVLALLPNGQVASTSEDRTIKLWNLANGQCETTLERHGGTVVALALLSDGRLAAGVRGNTIEFWNLTNLQCVVIQVDHIGSVQTLAPLHGGWLASGAHEDPTIRLWWSSEKATWTSRVAFVADYPITTLAYGPNHRILAAGDEAGRMHFLKLEGFEPAEAGG